MKIETSKLTGAALDWAVAKCEGGHPVGVCYIVPNFSTDWSQGGPIIDEADIAISPLPDGLWRAYAPTGTRALHGRVVFDWKIKATGFTPLIAAMRCYVASKLGDEMEVPDELA